MLQTWLSNYESLHILTMTKLVCSILNVWWYFENGHPWQVLILLLYVGFVYSNCFCQCLSKHSLMYSLIHTSTSLQTVVSLKVFGMALNGRGVVMVFKKTFKFSFHSISSLLQLNTYHLFISLSLSLSISHLNILWWVLIMA